MKNNIPVWEKYLLTIPEAAGYFGVGEKRIRTWVNDNCDSACVIWVGSRPLIKRKMFETYLEKVNVL